MDPKRNIQRNIRGNTRQVGSGDAPAIGRVGRMQRGARKGPASSTSSLPAGQRAKRWTRIYTIGWTVALGLASLGALATIVFFAMRPGADRRSGAPALTADQFVRPDMDPLAPVGSGDYGAPDELAALDLVRDALTVTDVEGARRLFLPGETPIEEIPGLIQELSEEDGFIRRLEWLGNINANGLALEGVLVHYDAPLRSRNRLAILTQDEESEWKVDFESFARTVRPSWEEIADPATRRATVRVFLSHDNHYLGRFSDERVWASIGLASPDSEQTYYGYCRRDSPQYRAIDRILRRVRTNSALLGRATLEVIRVDGGADRQFLIESVLAEDWVVGERRFDEESTPH